MQSSAREEYLKTQVMTAAPQKLQLMLIDAAIRSAQKAKQHWNAGEDDLGFDHLIHCQEVVGELLASTGSCETDVAAKLASIYLFLFRTLSEVHVNRDLVKLDDVLRVLELERETWLEVCQRFGTTRDESRDHMASSATESLITSIDSAQTTPKPPRAPRMPPLDLPDTSLTESGGISFEA